MTDYQIVGVRADVVSWIAREPLAAAIWNLYWLSEPQLDALPGAGMRWINRFRPQAGGLAAVIRDVNQDPLLARKLREPPGQFLSWFETEDATIFDSHVAFGDDWPATVVKRAHLAILNTEGRKVVSGNVVQVNFRRRA
jgi:hypothetical protein